jgi:nucleotide-binding universal stress UspA family protein
MRVLCGVDGSPAAAEAVRQVSHLLTPGQDELAFFFSPPELHVVGEKYLEPRVLARVRQGLTSAVFDAARSSLPLAMQGKVHEIVGEKDARHGLLAAAAQWHAELIVVGARGLGRVERWLLGSVSAYVARAAHLAVLVARQRRERPNYDAPRVLFTCDGSSASRQAAEFLWQFHWPVRTTGLVLTVMESPLGAPLPEWLESQLEQPEAQDVAEAWRQHRELAEQARRQEIASFCQQLPAPFQEHRPLVLEGHAAERILHALDAEDIDLVVLGSRARRSLLKSWLGGTCEKVLSHAPCSVLIVPEVESP